MCIIVTSVSTIAWNKDRSIDATPSVDIIQSQSKAWIVSSPAYKHYSLLALLYKVLGWTESWADDKSSHV